MSDLKELLASETLPLLANENLIGIGTGRTARTLIEKININKELFINKKFIASSIDSEIRLSNYGFNVLSLYIGVRPDIYVDSFDSLLLQKDINNSVMIKGGGAALFREKILASYSKHRVYIGEYTKIINRDSSIKIPVEVLPVAHKYVIDSLKEKGIEAKPRESDGKIGSVFSDNGNMILDLEIKNEIDLCELDKKLKNITGILETGIFCSNLIDKIIIARKEDEIEIVEKSSK